MDRVGRVKQKFRFALSVFIGGMVSTMLVSCAARGVKTIPATQARDTQQNSSFLSGDAQQSASPVSLETFSAFLDRC